MAISKRFLYTIITILLLAATALFAAFIGVPRATTAEEANTIALSPVKTEGDDVTYYCFDNPASVFADGEVKLVAGQNGIYSVYDNAENGEKEILLKNIPADKVYRHVDHESTTEYLIVLIDGQIYSVGSDDAQNALNINDEVVDFCVSGETLYAITTTNLVSVPLLVDGIDGQNAKLVPLVSDRHSVVTAKRITAAVGKLYVSIKAVFGNKWDVCSAAVSDTVCTLDTVLNQSNDVLSLTSNQNGVIYTLTRSEVVGYTASVGGGLIRTYSADGSDFTDIYAFGESLYALDTLNALHIMSDKLTSDTVIAASASAAEGFFNIPFGMTAKKSTLYMADTGNNRIAVYENGGIRYIAREFRSPVSVAADNAGTLYVAYDDNKVGVFIGNSYGDSDEIKVATTEFGKIRQIAVDIEKTLFILSDSGLWRVGRDYIPRRIGNTTYKAIALSIGKSNLYALNSDKIVWLDKSSGEIKGSRPAKPGAISIAADLNDTVFVLYNDRIESVTASDASTAYTLSLDDKTYTLGEKFGQIMLCFMEDGLDADNDEHNYVIVLDTYRHRVLKANGTTLGARFVDYSYVSPDIVESTAPVTAQNGIIRKARFDTPLFDYPIETKSNYTVLSGSYVIMPDYNAVAPGYNPDETPEFALVLIDDVQNNRLIQGYVYKDALTEPLKYSPPPSNVCTVTGELGTILYKWPSRNAKAVDGDFETSKNTKFDMLDFVDAFQDGYGYYWYRLALDNGTECYVPAVNVSTIDYHQANILPDYNAEIIAYDGNNYAKTYTLDNNGKYIEVRDVTLRAGTQVEVVGSFDSSERYTKIKYLDEKTHKTVTCYVETVHVKFTGVNIVLLVAIVVIAITLILAIIIIARVYYAKKKRLDNDGDNKGKDNDADDVKETD